MGTRKKREEELEKGGWALCLLCCLEVVVGEVGEGTSYEDDGIKANA